MNARLMVTMAAMLLAGAASGPTWGQAYPSKPVRAIPGSPGGLTDLLMQIIREPMSSRLGQPVIVDYRPATLMGGLVAHSQPDGYTLLVAGASVWFGPLLEKTDYDTLKDFVGVSSMTISPALLVVNPSLPVNSVKELIAYAKARPGALNYSSGANGSSYHLGGELFKTMAGVDIVRVNYTGAGPILQAVLSGETQMTFSTSAPAIPLIKAGKLKALAHTSLKPTALAPDLPSMASAGLPGFSVTSASGMFVPVKTPDAIVRRLNQELVWALSLEDVRQKLLALGVEADPSTPEEFAVRVKSDYANVEKLLKGTGITAH